MQQQPRHFTGGLEDEGIGTGRMRLEQTKDGIVHLGVGTDLGQIRAHQGEVVLVVQGAQPLDALDGLLVAEMAAQA